LYPSDLIKITRAEQNPFYTGLDYLPDGRLIAIDNLNKKLLVLSEKLVVLGSYNFEYHPQSVVVIFEDEVAVTTAGAKMIIVLHISISNKISKVRVFKTDLQNASICMMDDGHFVIGTLYATNPACIVSLAGEKEDFNFDFPRKKYKLGDHFCTFLRDSNKLVVSQRFENTVTIYDIATRKTVTVKDDIIKQPCGVAAGPFDCIFLCSSMTHSIVQISPDGCIITSFKTEIIMPFCISFSKSKSTLAVANCAKGNRKYLQVFKVDFGNK
jgi:WD40 repeat protein